MSDTISLLNERLKKAQAKAERYQKMLDSTKNEVDDIETTLRILGEIGNESPDVKPPSASPQVSNRQREIVEFLGDGYDNAKPPVTLFDTYSILGSDNINIDTFRTTIWRMKDKVIEVDGVNWTIKASEGLYWKHRTEPESTPASPEWPARNEPTSPLDDNAEPPF